MIPTATEALEPEFLEFREAVLKQEGAPSPVLSASTDRSHLLRVLRHDNMIGRSRRQDKASGNNDLQPNPDLFC